MVRGAHIILFGAAVPVKREGRRVKQSSLAVLRRRSKPEWVPY